MAKEQNWCQGVCVEFEDWEPKGVSEGEGGDIFRNYRSLGLARDWRCTHLLLNLGNNFAGEKRVSLAWRV